MASTPDFGIDLDWRDDLNPTGRLVSGIELLSQAAYQRLHTPRGACLDAPNDGLDLAEFLSRGMTPAQLAGVPGDVRSELLKDDRFLDATVTLAETSPGAFTLRIRITPSAGPEFSLVLSVADAAVKLLSFAEIQ